MSKLLEAIKNKKQAIAAKQGRERPVKLSSAKNLIRLMPNWAGEEDGAFSQEFGQHFIKDKPGGNILAVYICTANTFGKPCDVCAKLAQAQAQNTDEAVAEALAEARPSQRVLINAIYMNGTHANAKTDPVLLEIPVSVFGDILAIMETYLEDHDINIMDLQEGYDMVINKTGSGRETKYTVTPSPKPRAIAADTLSKCKDLNAYAQQEYAEGLQKALASLSTVAGALSAPSAAARLAGPAATPPKSAAQNLADTQPADLDVLEAEFTDVTDDAPFEVDAAAPAANDTLMEDMDDLERMMAEAGLK